MICLQTNLTTGALELVSPQPADFSTCTYVVQSGAEVVASPFALDGDAAAELAAAIAMVWTLAFIFRLLRRQLEERL